MGGHAPGCVSEPISARAGRAVASGLRVPLHVPPLYWLGPVLHSASRPLQRLHRRAAREPTWNMPMMARVFTSSWAGSKAAASSCKHRGSRGGISKEEGSLAAGDTSLATGTAWHVRACAHSPAERWPRPARARPCRTACTAGGAGRGSCVAAGTGNRRMATRTTTLAGSTGCNPGAGEAQPGRRCTKGLPALGLGCPAARLCLFLFTGPARQPAGAWGAVRQPRSSPGLLVGMEQAVADPCLVSGAQAVQPAPPRLASLPGLRLARAQPGFVHCGRGGKGSRGLGGLGVGMGWLCRWWKRLRRPVGCNLGFAASATAALRRGAKPQ